jgi:hypothetical protein
LHSGRLERLGLPAASFAQGYSLAAKADRRRERAVAAVWQWLKAEGSRTPNFLEAANADHVVALKRA